MRANGRIKAIGFTLVELVVILLLLGILSVVVFPRFQGDTGYAEYGYRARLISSLRTMQYRAMQDTRAGYCFQVNFVNGANSAFGPPTLDYTGTTAATCATSISSDAEDEFAVATAVEMADDGVVLAGAPATLEFRDMGQPFVGGAVISSQLQISVIGQDTLTVCIEPQGYVHDC